MELDTHPPVESYGAKSIRCALYKMLCVCVCVCEYNGYHCVEKRLLYVSTAPSPVARGYNRAATEMSSCHNEAKKFMVLAYEGQFD